MDISVKLEDHVATVTVDRPPVNAVTRATFDEIRDAFRSFNDDREVRVAIFTAVGDRASRSSLNDRNASRISSNVARVTAFTGGRSSVTVAT